MASRARKRQKTDPSPTKPNVKTLFHFFSRPAANSPIAVEITPPRTNSDSGSIYDESRRKSDIGPYDALSVPVKPENTPPLCPTDESQPPIKAEDMEFVAAPTEREDTCLQTTKDQIHRSQGSNLPDEIEDDVFRDDDFCQDELDFPYEPFDENYDPIDQDESKLPVRQEDVPPDPTVDEGPSCPFCNFSFKGLPENVLAHGDVTKV
jgi:hypothetical protein